LLDTKRRVEALGAFFCFQYTDKINEIAFQRRWTGYIDRIERFGLGCSRDRLFGTDKRGGVQYPLVFAIGPVWLRAVSKKTIGRFLGSLATIVP
jgi:hypothetical protein